MMKKVLCWVLLLALLLMQFPIAEAAGSKTNDDIPKVVIEEDEPDDKPDDDPGPTIEIVDDTPEIDELIEDMQATYTLTIYYVFRDGSKAAETYSEVLDTGTPYNVASPAVDGYTPTVDSVTGTMPKRNLVFTVVYLRPEEDISTLNFDDYETPLGVGASNMNLGVSVD